MDMAQSGLKQLQIRKMRPPQAGDEILKLSRLKSRSNIEEKVFGHALLLKPSQLAFVETRNKIGRDGGLPKQSERAMYV